MTTTSAQEAIAVLIDLAQQGEIDPWDVQVITVIDRFLSELGLLDDLKAVDQQDNLSQSGQAFLWASMLVLLKADTLEQLEAEEEEGEFLDASEFLVEDGPVSVPLYLERRIRRRSSAPPPRRRRVTLEELIGAIEQMAAELAKVSTPNQIKRPRPQSRREALQIITELAHQENLTELASQLEAFLQRQLPQLAPEKLSVELDELLNWWTEFTGASSPDSGSLGKTSTQADRVGVFWALLLLSAQSKVALSQSEFYHEIQIQVL